jgi:hypothetical protein
MKCFHSEHAAGGASYRKCKILWVSVNYSGICSVNRSSVLPNHGTFVELAVDPPSKLTTSVYTQSAPEGLPAAFSRGGLFDCFAAWLDLEAIVPFGFHCPSIRRSEWPAYADHLQVRNPRKATHPIGHAAVADTLVTIVPAGIPWPAWPALSGSAYSCAGLFMRSLNAGVTGWQSISTWSMSCSVWPKNPINSPKAISAT